MFNVVVWFLYATAFLLETFLWWKEEFSLSAERLTVILAIVAGMVAFWAVTKLWKEE